MQHHVGAPLPEPVRLDMERAFGADLSTVRVHREPGLRRGAFAHGEHLHFAPGGFRPDTPGGRRLLGHELAHVLQQRARRLPPGEAGVPRLEDSPTLEREADRLGARAAEGGDARQLGSAPPARPGVIQGELKPEEKDRLRALLAAKLAAIRRAAPPSAGASVSEEEGKSVSGHLSKSDKLGKVIGTRSGVAAFAAAGGAAMHAASDATRPFSMLTSKGIVGVAKRGDTAHDWWASGDKKDKAVAEGDLARSRMLEAEESGHARDMASGAVDMAESGLKAGAVARHGKEGVVTAKTALSGARYTASGLSRAAAGASLATSTADVLREGRRVSRSVVRTGELAAASSSTAMAGMGHELTVPASWIEEQVLTPMGERWRLHLLGRERLRGSVSGLKMAGAGAGAVGAGLLLASNPVGWTVAAGGAVVGAGLGAAKAIDKGRELWEHHKAVKEMEGSDEVRFLEEETASAGVSPGERSRLRRALSVKLIDESRARRSANHRIASELRAALEEARELTIYELRFRVVHAERGVVRLSRADAHAHDALMLLRKVGISREQALSERGQDLIAKKISVRSRM
ncbi:MAG: DUF4157 domain-containing protein [Alphaproteobacteria bacterium]|nr:DUF4157 domain-containing protein [Alphaproteobacteria bacterium]